MSLPPSPPLTKKSLSSSAWGIFVLGRYTIGSKLVLSLPIDCRGHIFCLHTRIGGCQFKISLDADKRKVAIIRADNLLSILMAKQSPIVIGGINPVKANGFEIDIGLGIFRSNGPEDPQRMMEALAILK